MLIRPFRRPTSGVAILVACVAFAVALHWPRFGDPTAGLDEQFYLLVGDRMWSGALPYVDIWDRKPAGLFALYALIRLLPGDGVLAYQCVATAFLALTGWTVALIARRTLPPLAACAAGLATIFYSVLLGQGFGEAPMFYDLLLAAAAWLILAIRDAPDPRPIDPRALLAMGLCGLSLTLKTSAVFEGCAFGLLLLAGDRHAGFGVGAARAASYLLLGLLPTLGIATFYAAIGAFGTFWFANVQSIFLRGGGATLGSLSSLVATLLMLAPLLLALVEARGAPDRERTVLLAWLAAATLEFVAIGHFYFHYALPMLAPLAILAARALRHPVAARLACGAAALWALAVLHEGNGAAVHARADLAALAAALPAEVRTRCLFVHEGPVALYALSHACLPGRYVFPGHFTAPDERFALERPADRILAETLARRPAAIVSTPDALDRGSAASAALLAATIARDYRYRTAMPVDLDPAHPICAIVWSYAPGRGAGRNLVSQISRLGAYPCART